MTVTSQVLFVSTQETCLAAGRVTPYPGEGLGSSPPYLMLPELLLPIPRFSAKVSFLWESFPDPSYIRFSVFPFIKCITAYIKCLWVTVCLYYL